MRITLVLLLAVLASFCRVPPVHAWRTSTIPPRITASGSTTTDSTLSIHPTVRRASPEKQLTTQRQRLLRLTNAARKAHHLPLLTRSAALETAAQAYADDLARRGFFSHTDPEGRTPDVRIAAAGYRAMACRCAAHTYTGENIAKGQGSVTEVFRAWMASTGHRAAILYAGFREIGIGMRDRYWVQDFGSPAAVKPRK